MDQLKPLILQSFIDLVRAYKYEKPLEDEEDVFNLNITSHLLSHAELSRIASKWLVAGCWPIQPFKERWGAEHILALAFGMSYPLNLRSYANCSPQEAMEKFAGGTLC